MFPTTRFHQLEPILLSVDGLSVANKPPVGLSGRMEGDRFFTCMHKNQYYCVEIEDKNRVVVKVYLRLSPWTKQRAMETIVVADHDIIKDADIDRILSIIRDTPKQERPLPGAPVQQIYGGSGFHPLSGYYMQLSKKFLDSLGEREQRVLNELDYIENIITTPELKLMVLHGFDGDSFSYDLIAMRVA